MGKDPAVLFYCGDFLTGCSDLTMEERGQYISLLCLQHQKGHLSEKTIRLSVGSVSVDVMKKFSVDENGLFYNKRMDEESEKRAKFTESRRINGLSGGRPKKEKPYAKPTKNHKDTHKGNLMGNENENEDINRNDIENRKAKFISEVSGFRINHSDEMLKEFCEYWTEHNPDGKKMRFELEKVFDLNRRINTWSKNQKQFNKNARNQPPTAESLAAAIAYSKAERGIS